MSSRSRVATPSSSNGALPIAFGICGRSLIEKPAGNTCCPTEFNRKEDCRYWLLPRIAAAKCPIRPRAISGLNNTAARRVRELARLQARDGAPRALAPDGLGVLQVAPVPRTRVPIVALHVLPAAGEHAAAQGMGGGRIAPEKAVSIAVDMQSSVRVDRCAFRVVDPRVVTQAPRPRTIWRFRSRGRR